MTIQTHQGNNRECFGTSVHLEESASRSFLRSALPSMAGVLALELSEPVRRRLIFLIACLLFLLSQFYRASVAVIALDLRQK